MKLNKFFVSCAVTFILFFPTSIFALTKEELFSKLYENNFMLKKEQATLSSLGETPSTIISAPEIAILEMNSNVPFVDSKMKMQRSIEIGQMLPNPLKISSDKLVKKQVINTQSQEVTVLYKKLKLESYNLFLGIFQNEKEFEIFKEKEKQLSKFLNRLRSSQVQGQEEKIQISEVLSEKEELEILIFNNQSENKRMKNMLNQMLGLSLNSPIENIILDEISLNKELNLLNNSEVKLAETKIQLMEADLSMKKTEFFPEFSFKVRLNKSYSEKIDDSKEIMLGITLPFLFWDQQTGEIDSTKYKIEGMKYEKINLQSEVESKKENIKNELVEMNNVLKFYKTSLLNIKERKFKLYSGYSYTDMKTIMNYKMSFDDLIMLKMKILKTEIDLHKKYFEWTELEG